MEAHELEPFLTKEYRDEYLDTFVKGSIAHQIQALREAAGLTQKQFGDLIGKPQSVVSRLEDTEYGAVTVQTLLEIAKARDVALQIKFCDYVDIITADISEAAFKVDTVRESYQKLASCSVVNTVNTRAFTVTTQATQASDFSIAVGAVSNPGIYVYAGTETWQTNPVKQSTKRYRASETTSIGTSTRTPTRSVSGPTTSR